MRGLSTTRGTHSFDFPEQSLVRLRDQDFEIAYLSPRVEAGAARFLSIFSSHVRCVHQTNEPLFALCLISFSIAITSFSRPSGMNK